MSVCVLSVNYFFDIPVSNRVVSLPVCGPHFKAKREMVSKLIRLICDALTFTCFCLRSGIVQNVLRNGINQRRNFEFKDKCCYYHFTEVGVDACA